MQLYSFLTRVAGIRPSHSLGWLRLSLQLLLTFALILTFNAQAQTTGAAFNLPACAGNIATDDTPILWNAINTSSSNVFFVSPSKVCYVNFVNAYTLPRGVKLVGTPGRSVLRPFSAAKSLFVISNSDISLEGLTLDSNVSVLSGTQSSLIFVSKASRVNLLNNCLLSSATGGTTTGTAVWYWNSSGRIQDNDFTSFQNHIIVKADLGINPDMSIVGNHMHDNSPTGGNAIAIMNNGGSTKVNLPAKIDANNIHDIYASSGSSGQDGNAIDIYLANHVRVTNNHVENVGFSCFRSASADDAVFTANSCITTGESAAYSEFSAQHNQWLDNYFENAHGACLNLTNLNVGGEMHTAIGNHMLKCGSSGIHAEGNAILSGNSIDQSANGILVGYGSWGMNVLVKNNLITDTSGDNLTKFGIGVEDGSTVGIEIEGNKIDLPANRIIATSYGVPSSIVSMPPALTIRNQVLPFAMLGTPANGSFVYCADCSVTPVCRPWSTGAFAKRINGAWNCQ